MSLTQCSNAMFNSGIAMTNKIIVQNGNLEQEALFWNVCNVITFMGKISVDMDDSIYSGILIIALGCASKEQNTKRLEADVLRGRRTKIFHVCVQIPFLLTYSELFALKALLHWSRCSSVDAVLYCVLFYLLPFLAHIQKCNKAIIGVRTMRANFCVCFCLFLKNCSLQSGFL